MGDVLPSDVLAIAAEHAFNDVVSFGPFTLYPVERRLERAGATVRLGSRALDILVVLIQHAGEVVDRRSLMSRAWRNIVVDESNLRVHIASLRKALGDGIGDAHYICNVPGIGYSFVGKPMRKDVVDDCRSVPADTAGPTLDARIVSGSTWLIGRDEDVSCLVATLLARRLISIVGPGGIGKTVVALALANCVARDVPPERYFVDLSEARDGGAVVLAIARRLGLSDVDREPTALVCDHLANRRALIVLDSCEHVIDAVTMVTKQVMARGAGTHFVLTSREVLRIKGEYVYRLSALMTPPSGSTISADDAHRYPATRLFTERALAAGANVAQTQANFAAIARMCDALGGVPLAIEIAAARVATFGLAGTLSLIGTPSRLRWEGCRNAPVRHQSLEASLDWSYQLLSDAERSIFGRLASLDQPATLEAILAIAADPADEALETMNVIERLVAKHLLTVLERGDAMYYRLPESERIYVRQRSALS